MSYAISGGHKKTIEAAEIILSQGGNAVDAAIAAYLVSFISEPCMASIGAGGFAMINDTKSIKQVDFFCQTPINKKKLENIEFYPIEVDFGNTQEEFHVGKGSIAVPGAIAGIFKMHEIWGSIPMSVIFEPALQWSKEGIQIDKFQAYDLILLENIFKINPISKELFFNSKKELKKEGDLVKMPQYHDFLEALMHEGEDLMYKGEIAKKISDDMKTGGHLTRADFEQYKAIVREPISFDFMNYKMCTTGFPSVGGMTITAILNTFQDSVAKENMQHLSLEHFQSLVSTFSSVQLLKNDPLKIARYLFDQFGINTRLNEKSGGSKWGGTSHFNVMDKNGMTVCLTTSIGEGSGYFIEGTDMQLNNMLGEEALMPNGFHNWEQDVRLQSMMSPSIVIDKDGKTQLAIGSGGAGRIPYAISQVIINMLYFGLDALAAVDSSRIHLQNGRIEMESGFNFHTDLMEQLNVWESKSMFFGGTNIIHKENKHYRGLADQRRHGSIKNSC